MTDNTRRALIAFVFKLIFALSVASASAQVAPSAQEFLDRLDKHSGAVSKLDAQIAAARAKSAKQFELLINARKRAIGAESWSGPFNPSPRITETEVAAVRKKKDGYLAQAARWTASANDLDSRKEREYGNNPNQLETAIAIIKRRRESAKHFRSLADAVTIPKAETEAAYNEKVRLQKAMHRQYQAKRWDLETRADRHPHVKAMLGFYQEAQKNYERLVEERRKLSLAKVAMYEVLLLGDKGIEAVTPPFLKSVKVESDDGKLAYSAAWKSDLQSQNLQSFSRIVSYLDGLKKLRALLNKQNKELQAEANKQSGNYRIIVDKADFIENFDLVMEVMISGMEIGGFVADPYGTAEAVLGGLKRIVQTLISQDPGDLGEMKPEELFTLMRASLKWDPKEYSSLPELAKHITIDNKKFVPSAPLHTDLVRNSLKGADLNLLYRTMVVPQADFSLEGAVERVLTDHWIYLEAAFMEGIKYAYIRNGLADRFLKANPSTPARALLGFMHDLRVSIQKESNRVLMINAATALIKNAYIYRAISYRRWLLKQITEIELAIELEELPSAVEGIQAERRELKTLHERELGAGKYRLQLEFSRSALLSSVQLGELALNIGPNRATPSKLSTIPFELVEKDFSENGVTSFGLLVSATALGNEKLALDRNPSTFAFPDERAPTGLQWLGYEPGGDSNHKLLLWNQDDQASSKGFNLSGYWEGRYDWKNTGTWFDGIQMCIRQNDKELSGKWTWSGGNKYGSLEANVVTEGNGIHLDHTFQSTDCQGYGSLKIGDNGKFLFGPYYCHGAEGTWELTWKNRSCSEDSRTIETTYPINVTCDASGLECNTTYDIEIHTQGVLRAKYFVPKEHCGLIKVRFIIDDEEKLTSEILGYGGRKPVATKIFDFGPSKAGKHVVRLQAIGQKDGCIDQKLATWGGKVVIWTSK